MFLDCVLVGCAVEWFILLLVKSVFVFEFGFLVYFLFYSAKQNNGFVFPFYVFDFKQKKTRKPCFCNFLYWFKQEIDWDKGTRTASPMHPGGSLFNLCFTIWCTTQCLLHWPHAGILQWRSLSRHPTKSWQYSSLGVPVLPITTSDKQPSILIYCGLSVRCLEVLVHLLHWEHLSQPEWMCQKH